MSEENNSAIAGISLFFTATFGLLGGFSAYWALNNIRRIKKLDDRQNFINKVEKKSVTEIFDMEKPLFKPAEKKPDGTLTG